jgi:hypothetical protein
MERSGVTVSEVISCYTLEEAEDNTINFGQDRAQESIPVPPECKYRSLPLDHFFCLYTILQQFIYMAHLIWSSVRGSVTNNRGFWIG